MNQWIVGILFGGVLISSLGALSTYSIEQINPTIKSIMRDFIIGSILFCFIIYLLPESSLSLLTYLTTLSPFTMGVPSVLEDQMEIQVGLPKF